MCSRRIWVWKDELVVEDSVAVADAVVAVVTDSGDEARGALMDDSRTVRKTVVLVVIHAGAGSLASAMVAASARDANSSRVPRTDSGFMV